ncbi:MAG TPA: Na(+)-translocating NADH-quinone reductase subunit C [Planctomycetaceae bacterium]|nr:Na(+)-translocating NADH-quinone reductase subunit C [Planctomycetaceae bacterium]HRF00675.1 Na(+)-translocating NADH-quinone reductase subunit C [Pirellulaceae bacterium]
MQRDSIANTFLVAVTLCVVCAVMVSGAAVGLRTVQEANKQLDRQKNVLMAAGLIDAKADAAKIREVFAARISPIVVDLKTGEVLEGVDPATVDGLREAKSKDPELCTELSEDPAKLKARENRSVVYRVLAEGSTDKVELYVFPIRGYGLWSTLFGFIALEGDLNTVQGITYYQHGETPGLGGEVDNPLWKAKWQGKSLYDAEGEVALRVVKGGAAPDAPSQVDALSGASITSVGVENMIRFWFGDLGFRSFVEKNRSAAVATAAAGGEEMR